MKEAFIEKNFTQKSLERLALANKILDEYKAQGFSLTLRQLYYQLVARGFIENSQRSYKRLGNLINDARLAGHVDWHMITDRGRSSDLNSHWDNPGQIVKSAARSFAIDKWEDQPNHLEVMVEKDALSGVLWPVCSELDIHFTANKGYPSASLLYNMAKRIRAQARLYDKRVYILHLGDHDPSGIDMTRDLADRLGLLAEMTVEIDRLALNMDQVEKYNPPENPAKITDSRYHAYVYQYGESSWELDALEPRVLADLVAEFVKAHRDEDLWKAALAREDSMRDELWAFVKKYQDEKDGE